MVVRINVMNFIILCYKACIIASVFVSLLCVLYLRFGSFALKASYLILKLILLVLGIAQRAILVGFEKSSSGFVFDGVSVAVPWCTRAVLVLLWRRFFSSL